VFKKILEQARQRGGLAMKKQLAIKTMMMLTATIFLFSSVAAAQVQTRYEQTPTFSKEELAQMLAPIALYPDALLSQILIAASYPYEVVEADRWLDRNPNLTDEQLDEALLAKDWDVSVLSLCHYPKVIKMMAENLTWTAKLGDAFVYQREDVLDTVQDLRARAAAQGNLKSTDEQRVIVEERIIRIEPAYYHYLYVPVYDPLVVYGPWWLPAFLPYRIFYPGVVVVGPRIIFSPRLFISFGVVGWADFDWHARHIMIRDIERTRRFNRHYHVYYEPQRTVYWKPLPQKRVIHERSRYEYYRPKSSGAMPRERKSTVVLPPRSQSPVPAAPRPEEKTHRPVLTPKEPGGRSVLDRKEPGKKEEMPKGQPKFKHQSSTPSSPQLQGRIKSRPSATPIQIEKSGKPSSDRPSVAPRAGVIQESQQSGAQQGNGTGRKVIEAPRSAQGNSKGWEKQTTGDSMGKDPANGQRGGGHSGR